MTRKRIALNADDIVREYLAGVSEKKLADRFNVSRTAIRRRLIESGVNPRGRSEAELVKWSQMSARKRKAQTDAAHDAVRGKPVAMEVKIKQAIGKQRTLPNVSPIETLLADMLKARGIATIPQQAIGPYNCDLGAYPVAVEIFGGEWHWSGRHLLRTPERFRYILNAGWHILVVKVTPRRDPLTEATADYVAAFIETVSRDPSLIREYRVIRGAGEVIAAGSADDDNISIVPSFTRGRNSKGQYCAVPR